MTENKKNYFFWNKQAFEDTVREIVCPRCPYFGLECKNPDPHGCALFRHLPDLVRIAQRMKNPSLQEYSEEVKREVPFHCEWTASPDHPCRLMDSPDCGMDELLPAVLEAVLKADKSLESQADPNP